MTQIPRYATPAKIENTSEIHEGDRVEFEVEAGKLREGIVTSTFRKDFWRFTELGIEFDGKKFSRMDREVRKIDV